MSKHQKPARPSDADLRGNPLIGGSKGAGMAGARTEDIEDIRGQNTIEGDRENDVNRQGGIDKPAGRRNR